MKLPFQAYFRLRPADMLKGRRATILLVGLFLLSLCALVWFLYYHVVRSVLLPKEIDPRLVTAKQEKVNRTLLDTLLKNDAAKHVPAAPLQGNDPFSP